VACAAAGSGIAIVPRSVLELVEQRNIDVRPLPRDIAHARTQLVWREGHRSAALGALRELMVSDSRCAAPARAAGASLAYRSASRPPVRARRSPRS
ncbi:MAG: LysR family transcriptional regulator, partial [Betaproteobacteria bacterium]|nr:LysR family transcriptional regulator [Betaproteobacteria bacterium]